jgi:tetratricopeptide (TPR) repeat protein
LISLSLQQQTLAHAKGDTERKQLELKLAAERERRKAAEAEAKRNQELYQAALVLAERAMTQQQYEVAQAKYHEAGKLFATDAVATGLRRAESARAERVNRAEAERTKETRAKQLAAEGKASLDARDYAKAVAKYQDAKKLDPDSVEVLAGLTVAEQARSKQLASAQRETL